MKYDKTKTLFTTLNRIREQDPCLDGWKTLLKYLNKNKADNEPLPLLTILNSNGIDDCLWCLRTIDNTEAFSLHFAIDCAEHVKPPMPDKYSTAAIAGTREYVNGQASNSKYTATRNEAKDTARIVAWRAAWNVGRRAAKEPKAWNAERKWQADHLRAALIDVPAYLASKQSR